MTAQSAAAIVSPDCLRPRPAKAADDRSTSAERATPDLGSRIPSQSIKLSRALRNVRVDQYRLANDGRKSRARARDRMVIAEWLATYADADGSRVFPAVKTMCNHFGWSRAKTFRLLADLKKLKLLEDEKNVNGKRCLTGEHGTRKRRINLPAFLSAQAPSSLPGPGPVESRCEYETPAQTSQIRENDGEQTSQICEQESPTGGDTTVTVTDQTKNQNLRPPPRPSSTPPCLNSQKKAAMTCVRVPDDPQTIAAREEFFRVARRIGDGR
jgi:hypothetical protein